MTSLPRVTVLVPARDEAAHIGTCIEHIARQDYAANWIQVLVVDGGSRDATADVARSAIRAANLADAHVVDNRVGTTPSSLNVGLAKASGEIVCRVDARTHIEPHYVRRCVEVLTERPDVAVVGGAQHAIAVDRHAVSVGIARALNNRYAMGFSRYRRATESGPSDTVYLGAFRTDDLRAVGGWDERLPTNQDFDLNRRMGQTGLVWFDSCLRSGYVPRPSIGLLWRQYRRFGRAKVRYWRSVGDRPQPRQLAIVTGGAAGAFALVVWLLFPARSKVITGVPALVAVAVVEHVGATDPPGGFAARVYAGAAMAATSAGWLTGLAGELVRSASEANVEHGDGSN